MVRYAAWLPALILAGCASQPPPVPVPVTIPGPVQYVPVPADLLVCVTDDDQPQTNGQLLESWRSRGERLEACAARMREIGALTGR